MAAAPKEKAPTDPAELAKWRAEEQAKERARRDKEKTELGSLGASATLAGSDGADLAHSQPSGC